MTSRRERCLETARQVVTKDRASAYGSAEDNFSNIAEMWNAQGLRIDGRQLVAGDVALLMIGMKLARLRHNPSHEDSWVDVAGYAACGMEVGVTVDEVQRVIEQHAGKGWVSDMYRCSEDCPPVNGSIGAAPHAPHAYGATNGGWCDGYI